ncbi:flavodoxin domain-containing protein [Thermophilibacter mediterraneus]|uniref:flavodoxin domain-containing protein n=1 Tax=Thermophilibacter mediterraneus TaxID=1871031 RepID=UPI00320822F3
MSTAVVYCSQTGYTEKYARWLADSVGCEPIPFAERGTAAVDAADTVVLLGWFHAGGLKGARWLRSLMDARPERRYIVVGVGAYPMPSDEWPRSETDAAFEHAFPHERYPRLACFYCQGGFDFDRLCAVDKLAMRAFFRMQAKEAKTDPRAAFALDAMREGFDGTRCEYLEPVLDHLRG